MIDYNSNKLSLYVVSAIVMLILEFFVLIRVYRRPQKIQTISLIVAPLMIVVALWITNFIQTQFNITRDRLNPFVLFVVLALLELPLSLYGYDLTPNASVPERVVVAGVFGVASVLIAQAILMAF